MRFLAAAISLAILLTAPSAFALELYVWKPYPSFAGILIPALDSERPEQAAKRYLEALMEDPDLRDLTTRVALLRMPLKNFSKLSDNDFERRVLVIANSPSHLNPLNPDTAVILNPLREAGAVPYILPIAADARIESDSDDVIDQLDTHFPSFLAIGGNDVDRRVFNESNELSVNVNFRRDLFESALLRRKVQTIQSRSKTWKPSGSAILLRQDRLAGICRGAQLTAKVMGHRIGNDIQSEIPWAIRHGAGVEGSPKIPGESYSIHPIDLIPTTMSVLQNLFGGANSLDVNSFHHQYIELRAQTPVNLQLSAISSRDGIAEAFESPDGNVLLVQFHPEHMGLMAKIADFLTPMRPLCPKLLLR